MDTGTTHTLLPRTMLNELGVEVLERLPFHLADERTVEYDLGEARVRLDGRGRTTVVIFGPEGVSPLSPNPPKDTDGRREESGRGVRELQGK